MRDEIYRLLLIDGDRIFRMGMRSWLAQFSELEVVAEAETVAEAVEFLQGAVALDLVILDLNINAKNSESAAIDRQSGLELCQRLKSEYPQLPILVLSSPQPSELVEMVLLAGVEGYCLKGNNPDELTTAIRLVASGNQYLDDRQRLVSQPSNQANRLMRNLPEQTVVAIVKRNFYLSGMRGIDRVLAEVKANLANTNSDQITDQITKMILAGQARELQAARWLVNRLWGQQTEPAMPPANTVSNLDEKYTVFDGEISDRTTTKANNTAQDQTEEQSRNNALAVQASLWDKTVNKLQSSLLNISKTPLEIDILKDEKKRQLLYIALRQIEQIITDLRFSQIQPSQLELKIPDILKSIWQETIINFFGKYYVLNNIDSEVNVVDVLLKDEEIVQTEFLDKIPQFDNLLSHLLFETELVIDDSSAAIGTPEAMQRVEMILDNLIIQIANAVTQPLLNNFANIEEIKHNFYRYNLLATREIERFRNDLSWKYRLEKYIAEPQLIFESRHVLLTFADRGIKRITIYTPRNQELQQLEGVQLAVTLVLELQDAIAPRLKSAIAFIGSGFVYVLTNVIGRGIGLIGRGVVQGIGNAWQENRNKK
ncbi:MAG: response regulator receiver domain protein [Cyanobacteriota bacterium]